MATAKREASDPHVGGAAADAADAQAAIWLCDATPTVGILLKPLSTFDFQEFCSANGYARIPGADQQQAH